MLREMRLKWCISYGSYELCAFKSGQEKLVHFPVTCMAISIVFYFFHFYQRRSAQNRITTKYYLRISIEDWLQKMGGLSTQLLRGQGGSPPKMRKVLPNFQSFDQNCCSPSRLVFALHKLNSAPSQVRA